MRKGTVSVLLTSMVSMLSSEWMTDKIATDHELHMFLIWLYGTTWWIILLSYRAFLGKMAHTDTCYEWFLTQTP